MARGRAFKRCVICDTRDFGTTRNEEIKRWTEANGATWTKELGSNVTHLVTSKKAWKQYHPLVKQARRMRTVQIVTYDWLEDSLQSRPVKALSEGPYLYEPANAKVAKKVRAKSSVLDRAQSTAPKDITIPKYKRIETSGIDFDKACKEFEQDMGTAKFHPYSDDTGFVYIVTLLRRDIFRNNFEKYLLKVGDIQSMSYLQATSIPELDMDTEVFQLPSSFPFSAYQALPYRLARRIRKHSKMSIAEPWGQCVQLYESNEEPHTYACYTQYTRPGVQKHVHVLAPPGSTWSFAWTMFTKFFKTKSGTTWNQRPGCGAKVSLDGPTCDLVKLPEDQFKIERSGGGVSRSYFQYLAPKIGDPEGIRDSSDQRPVNQVQA